MVFSDQKDQGKFQKVSKGNFSFKRLPARERESQKYKFIYYVYKFHFFYASENMVKRAGASRKWKGKLKKRKEKKLKDYLKILLYKVTGYKIYIRFTFFKYLFPINQYSTC